MINRILTDNGLAYDVISIVNRGSQGIIYKVQRKNKLYAAKIYSSVSHDLWTNVKQLIMHGAPDTAYVWPLHSIESPDKGYIMEYLDLSQYKSAIQLTNFNELSIIARMMLSVKLMEALLALHLTTGKIFGDISSNNILINPNELTIKIMDADSIGVNKFDVVGTSGYMSRKTMLEKKPTFESDVFAVFVLIHELIFSKHPFDGEYVKRFSTYEEGLNRSILDEKEYIFKPNNEFNSIDASEKKALAIWQHFIPKALKDTFVDMFDSKLSLESVIEIFQEHLNHRIVCNCGGETITTVCPKCYQTLEK